MATASIGGLTINNPLQLANTIAPKTPAATPTAPATPAFNFATAGTGVPQPLTLPPGAYSDTNNVTAGPTQNQIDQTNFTNSIPTAISNILQTGTDTTSGDVTALQSAGRGNFTTLNNGQNDINTSRANNELNRLNGINDITTFVRNGLHSGGAALSGMNASDSSGAEALARAYSTQGNDQAQSVNNQAAIQGHTIDTNQTNLNASKDQALQDFAATRDQYVNQIGSQAQSQLAALDAQGASVGINGQVDINGQKQAIIDKAMAALQGVDDWFKGQVGGIHAATPEETAASASQLQTAGTATPNPFSTTLNSGLPGATLPGPAIDNLPIFTSAATKKTN